jgi:hypothetical protein
MRTLKKVIASFQLELRSHPLFTLIDASSTREPLAAMARALAWWPMVFQDVLRLNLTRLSDSGLGRFAEYHMDEDAGHDRWYLEDLQAFGVATPVFDELFGSPYQPVRDVCYALIAEVLRDQSAAQRVALLLAMEPTGHVFFERVSAAVDRVCPDLPLRYFARSHLHVETGHDLFTESTAADIDQVVLNDLERARSEEAIERIYRAFGDLFSHLCIKMQEGVTAESYIRALRGPEELPAVDDASNA